MNSSYDRQESIVQFRRLASKMHVASQYNVLGTKSGREEASGTVTRQPIGCDEGCDLMFVIVATRIRIFAKHCIRLTNVFGWLVDFCQRTRHQYTHIRPNPVMGNEVNLLLDVSIRNERDRYISSGSLVYSAEDVRGRFALLILRPHC